MQTPTQAQQTILTADYPLDKVVFRVSGSRSTVNASSVSDASVITIPHGLPFIPLPIGAYSVDGFATSQDFGSGPYYYDGSVYGPRYFGNLEADATNIYVTLISWDAARTMNYRVIALAPSSIPATPFASPPRSGGLLFNSDDNYLKIFTQGTLVINDSGAFGFTNYTIDHLLNYVPTSLVFTEWGGRVRQVGSENAIGVAGIDALAWLTTTQLVISIDPYFAGQVKLHYKVYVDG